MTPPPRIGPGHPAVMVGCALYLIATVIVYGGIYLLIKTLIKD